MISFQTILNPYYSRIKSRSTDTFGTNFSSLPYWLRWNRLFYEASEMKGNLLSSLSRLLELNCGHTLSGTVLHAFGHILKVCGFRWSYFLMICLRVIRMFFAPTQFSPGSFGPALSLKMSTLFRIFLCILLWFFSSSDIFRFWNKHLAFVHLQMHKPFYHCLSCEFHLTRPSFQLSIWRLSKQVFPDFSYTAKCREHSYEGSTKTDKNGPG